MAPMVTFILILASVAAQSFEKSEPPEVIKPKLFDGDIVLPEEEYEGPNPTLRKAVWHKDNLWSEGPDGFPFVPYITQGSVKHDWIRLGLDHWMEHTCIKFQDVTNQHTINQPHLRFHNRGGCSSSVGMGDESGQDISISDQCNGDRAVIHEVGHALGFYHEQHRIDRDTYLVYNSGNVLPYNTHNFEKTWTNNYSVPYDYASIMHYGGRYLTRNGRLTLATRMPFAQELIGSETGLSHRDKLLANTMYGCIDKWVARCGVSAEPCQNEGFLGSNCRCVCPVHTNGSHCETVLNDDYYAHLLSPKTEKITNEGIIFAKLTGAGHRKVEQFTKHIVAPECKTAKLTFKEFTLQPQSLDNRYALTYCIDESLTIGGTGDNLYNGDVFCGREIQSGQSFTSSKQELILFSQTQFWYGKGSTWTAELTFENDPGCVTSENKVTTGTPITITKNPNPEQVTTKCTPNSVLYINKSESFTITSPSWPRYQHEPIQCKWTLKRVSEGKFFIICVESDLQPTKTSDGCQEYIQVAGRKYYGTDIPKITTEDEVVTFEYNKCYNANYSGFRCIAKVFHDEDYD